MTTFVLKGNRVVNDREPLLINGAGNHPRNPALEGLGYEVSLRSAPGTAAITTAVLSVSTEIDFDTLLAEKFPLTEGPAGEFTFSGIVGGAADPTGKAVAADPLASPVTGVVVYMSVDVRTSEGQAFNFERKLHYQSLPRDHAALNGREYVSPFAVPVKAPGVDVAFFPEWKDDTGVQRFGGAVTVEVFDDPGAPSAPPFLATPPGEVAIDTLKKLTLADRTGGGSIPGYTVPPYIGVFASGTDNFSRHFYFLRARYRSKVGSTTFVEAPLVLFGNTGCGTRNSDGDVGGIGIPPFDPPPTVDGPPIIEDSQIPEDRRIPDPDNPGLGIWLIKLDDPVGAGISGTYFSPVAFDREVEVFEFAPGTPFNAFAPASYQTQNEIRVREVDFKPALSTLPSFPFFMRVTEKNPDRTPSNTVDAPDFTSPV